MCNQLFYRYMFLHFDIWNLHIHQYQDLEFKGNYVNIQEIIFSAFIELALDQSL